MQYDQLATAQSLEKTIKSLKENGFEAISVNNKAEALEKIKTIIPAGASVMNGSSLTLGEIGFVDYLKSGTHGWNNLHANILAEKDATKQAELRKQSVISDFYLGSVHAVSETGEMVIASNSGSQLPHLAFTSPNVILVVGTQKITPDLSSAISRMEDYVFPLEDARAKSIGWGGSLIAKILILKKENKMIGRNFTVLFVNEKLGY
jgi:L-lactate utilization protein LutC